MLFEPQDGPRVFGQSPGCDLASDLVKGLLSRGGHLDPESFARTEIYVSISSLRSGLIDHFIERGDCLLPRIRLLSDLARHNEFLEIPELSPRIERRLHLAKLLQSLTASDRSMQSHGTVISLAESLETLLDEMDCEDVSFADLSALDLVDLSEHWHNSFTVLQKINRHWRSAEMPGEFGRMLMVVKALQAKWSETPPDHPIIVAGSTGSVGATRQFMQSVARLPQGAVVLPCFGRELPVSEWETIQDIAAAEHPQHNIAVFMQSLPLPPASVPPWVPVRSVNRERNALVSMMMRPAAGTHRWLREAPALDVTVATSGLTLIEAPSERQEATAIAIAIRQALEEEKSVALVTPDRSLIRQVRSALLRWSIIPDDKFGLTLDLTQAGSFLVAIARMMGRETSAVDIITLLEHPLSADDHHRDRHQQMTDLINKELRSKKPDADLLGHLHSWLTRISDEAVEWVIPWLELFEDLEAVRQDDLIAMIDRHQFLTTAALPGGDEAATWSSTDAGVQCQSHLAELRRRGGDYGMIGPTEYAEVVKGLLRANRFRFDEAFHPDIMIWNTEDARMQKPDLIIAGRLNAETWPPKLQPDPWLSRQIRTELALPLPEHRIGLSAHDFQHVMALEKVILTRCIETATESTLPSSWLVRLTSLLKGVGPAGQEALQAMTDRGRSWLDLVDMIDHPDVATPAAPRPAPRPPVDARPRQLAVTSLPVLITNPYAIYAQFILNLHTLGALSSRADPRVRGVSIHRIMERFVQHSCDCPPDEWLSLLQKTTDMEFSRAPAPKHVIMIWKAIFNRIVNDIVAFESKRHATKIVEKRGQHRIPGLDLTLTAKADRIEVDRDSNTCQLYDYKTGQLPSVKALETYDIQVPVLMKLASLGAFSETGPMAVSNGGFIRIGDTFEVKSLQDLKQGFDIEVTWLRVLELLQRFQLPETSYTARLQPRLKFGQDYDHLARYDEWRHHVADEPDDPAI